MRVLCLVFVSIFVFGCAAPTIMVEVPNIEKSSSMDLVDLRPQSEKENKIFSLSITSEAYGTYRRGDKLLDPSMVRIFQHRVFEKYAELEDVPEVKLHHFVVYMNLKSELRRGVTGGLLGGVVGAAVASGTQKYGIDGLASITTTEEFNAFEKEYKRALYTEEENPDKVSVFKVYLEAEIDGKRIFIETMTPTKLPDNKNPHVAAVETAIAYFLDQY